MKRLLFLIAFAGPTGLAIAFFAEFPQFSQIKPVNPDTMEVFLDCPRNGSISGVNDPRFSLNIRKNRYIAPVQAPFISLSRFLKATMDDHPGFDEADGATVEGYIGEVIAEGGESCNCGGNTPARTDEHIYLFRTKSDYRKFTETRDKRRAVVIETTPRVKDLAKQAGFDWSAGELKKLKGKKVRVRGWLLRDSQHAKQSFADGAVSPIHRATVWEIHPITSIELLTP